jgi:predicted DsbA family dithiol-disulfide isomerase
MSDGPTIQIDIVADTMCPWCYVGKRRIEKAIALRPQIEVDLRWRPFQLDPDIPPEGCDRKDYLKRKYGSAGLSATRFVPAEHAGAREGLEFAFDDITWTPNTFDSHRLIRWSLSAGCQPEMVETLFRFYLVEARDIGDREVLMAAAESLGMARELVGDLLDGDADRELIADEIALARKIGIEGVPCFIFDNKYVLQGAQEADILARALDKAAAGRH